jgi:hypothetical protein
MHRGCPMQKSTGTNETRMIGSSAKPSLSSIACSRPCPQVTRRSPLRSLRGAEAHDPPCVSVAHDPDLVGTCREDRRCAEVSAGMADRHQKRREELSATFPSLLSPPLCTGAYARKKCGSRRYQTISIPEQWTCASDIVFVRRRREPRHCSDPRLVLLRR